MRNNSDARRADVLSRIRSARAKHNGGKLVIVTLAGGDVDQAREMLEADHKVDSYEVQS